ncbi:hypothetical protein ADU59_00725 (plasmid) [Pararhizobium polonicum]|uniref:HTH araC/xylS-type domain-containing protein n=1 Tax=Pararhizobium polonicum TaxID=1612624 RepID=A0A1C7P8K7_9HYPH|nr:AraC family transcriptional regulator [Pararhizobium polonicum]OBZ97568.1 hypothetical protein ADU59_00725 [Pararhizobium polonicum]
MRPDRSPVYEPILPSATECFVWRQDDYPLSWSVWNAHPECEIHLIRNAEGASHIGDHVGAFSNGDLYLIGRGLPHNWVTPLNQGERVDGRDVILQFDEDRVLGISAAIPELKSLAPLLALARRGMYFEGEARTKGAEILLKIGQARGLERVSLFLGLLHILATSRERKLLSSEHFLPSSDPLANQTLRDVLTWMTTNYSRNVRLEQLAKMAKMTETSFSRFFKRTTGTTFSRYLSELRMAKACELLTRSDLPVTAIATDVGYDNLSNFNRTFRVLRGMPPSRYRQFRRST